MPSKQRRADVGSERARRIVTTIAGDIRRARQDRGLSQAEIGRAVGLSASRVSRLERGLIADMTIPQAARLLAVVGLELAARSYPVGHPVRDGAHLELIERFRVRLHPSLAWRTEVPVPIRGDLRGWDGVVTGQTWRVAVEAETRVTDCQALVRRLALKARDSGIDHVLLVLADSRHHRLLVSTAVSGLAEAFPLPGTVALERLGAAVDPGGSAIVFL